MQLTAVLFTTLSLLTTTLAAEAHVHNNCKFSIYYKSNSNNKVVELASKGTYSEPITRSGSSVQMGTYPGLSAPLTLEYTPSNGLTYYDLSNNAGNPFSTYHNELVPSISTCASFNCAANDAGCYSNGKALKIKTCKSTSDLTVTLCA